MTSKALKKNTSLLKLGKFWTASPFIRVQNNTSYIASFYTPENEKYTNYLSKIIAQGVMVKKNPQEW